MLFKQENFVLNVINDESPIIITVPHGGMKNSSGAWLGTLCNKRIKSAVPEENFIKGEKIVLVGDNNIAHIAFDIFKAYPVNVVIGLLPREFVDYNRFVPEVAYNDEKLKGFYDYYHQAISETIERLKEKWGKVFLFDLHGFGKQPIEGLEFDIVLGTNEETSIYKTDKALYDSLINKYQIFLAGIDGLPTESDLYRGDTTNLFYGKKYNIDTMLVEIAPRFRHKKYENSEVLGKQFSKDFGEFLSTLDGVRKT